MGGSKLSPEKEAETLAEFKSKIEEILTEKPGHYWYQDFYLKKWLIARDWNVKKAEEMFRESYAFKKSIKIDTLLETYKTPEVIQKYITGGSSGHDKEGGALRVELYGQLDYKGMVYACRKEDLLLWKMYLMQRALEDNRKISEQQGKMVSGVTAILDLNGMDRTIFWRPGLQLYLNMVRVMEDNYPDYLKRLFVINAPRVFPIIYKLARPLISEDTRRKIHVFGRDNYKETLLEHIDADQLPAFLGGTRTDPDGNPECRTMINWGGKIPEEFYLKDSISTANMTKATVSSGSKLCINQMVAEAGSLLRWEFMTNEFDLGFGVFHEPKPGKLKEVVKMERVNSHLVPEDGSYQCQLPGKYVIVFDNSFSWTRSKTVHYFIEVHADDKNLESEVQEMVASDATQL